MTKKTEPDPRLFAENEICDGARCPDRVTCARWGCNHDYRRFPRWLNHVRQPFIGRCPYWLRFPHPDYVPPAPTPSPATSGTKNTLGFPLTADDNRRIHQACLAAAVFMQRYGRPATQNPPDVELSGNIPDSKSPIKN